MHAASQHCLHCKRIQVVLYEFFTNTAHFPIASILLELLVINCYLNTRERSQIEE